MPHYTPVKRKRQNSGCCKGINLIKYMLHIFNFIFLVSGVAVLGVAIWTIFWKHQYVSLLATSTYLVGTYALAVAGTLAIIGSILACCGIFYEHRALILFYIIVLVLVFLLEAIIGGLAYVYETQIEEELQMTLNETFVTSYGIDERRTNAIDLMQQEYMCCGAISFEAWRFSVWYKSRRADLLRSHKGRLVPDSCCITQSDFCGMRDHPSNIQYTGCIHRFTEELRDHLTIISAVGLGICLIHVIGLILSCCLYIKLKDPDD